MVRVYHVAIAIGAIGFASAIQGQTRISSTTTTTSSIAWTALPAMPVPVSLGATARIAIKELHGYAAVGKVNGIWHRWGLQQVCVKVPEGWNCMPGQYKGPASSCCTWKNSEKFPYAPNAEMRALIDIAGTNPSQIFILQEIGTLASPVSAGGGMLQATLQPGQTLALINNRTLTVVKYGWGATDYVLQSGAQELDRWTTYGTVVMTDQSLRVAILRNIGAHRADNWGVPAGVLAKLQ